MVAGDWTLRGLDATCRASCGLPRSRGCALVAAAVRRMDSFGALLWRAGLG